MKLLAGGRASAYPLSSFQTVDNKRFIGLMGWHAHCIVHSGTRGAIIENICTGHQIE